MKQQRHIEITAFRRRTTIVLRDSAEVAQRQTLPAEDNATPLVRVDPAPTHDLDQPQTGPGQSNRVGNAKDEVHLEAE